MAPKDFLQTMSGFETIMLGAVGYPGVKDHVSLWGLLLPIRRSFEQYVNIRPVKVLRGVTCPRCDCSRVYGHGFFGLKNGTRKQLFRVDRLHAVSRDSEARPTQGHHSPRIIGEKLEPAHEVLLVWAKNMRLKPCPARCHAHVNTPDGDGHLAPQPADRCALIVKHIADVPRQVNQPPPAIW